MELTGKDGYRHILAGSVVFEHLPPAALDHIISRGLLVEVAPLEMVVAEGALGPGRCLGEYSLIDEHSTSAAARSMTGAKLFFLSREEFRSIAEGDARVGKVIYLNLLRFLITRLRAKDEELDLFMMGSL
jgi:CRP-like cAMP-binding protein